MKEKNTTAPGIMGTLAMLSLTLMGLGSNAITPALETLAAHFEGKNVSFIQTVATLSMVLGALIAGAIMGKRMKTRTLAVLGSALCLIFGILPVWIDDYALLLAVRFVFGFALGLISPLGNALIMMHFQGKKQASLLGVGTFAMNIGGIAFQLLAGVLAEKSWNLAFWGHIFFVIALIMAFFLPADNPENAAKEKCQHNNEKLNYRAMLIIGAILFVFQTVNLAVMMSASTIYDIRNAGGAAVAALALTAFSVAGVIAGLLYGPVFQKCKRGMFVFAFGAVALGALVILFGQNALIMGAGYAFVGIGFNWQLTAFMGWIGAANPVSRIGTGTSIALATMNLGGFVSSFWMIALGYDIIKILWADVILCAALAIILFMINPFKEKKEV